MAIVKCRECKTDVSTEAEKCPRCGAAPTKSAKSGKVIGALFFVGMMFYLFGGGIENRVADDAVKQYNIAKAGGDKMQICVHAGFVSAAYIQAQDEANYKKWQGIESQDCRAAGLPR